MRVGIQKSTVPEYLINSLTLNNEIHARSNRYSNCNVAWPRYARKTEGGKFFVVSTCKLWNSLPIDLKEELSVRLFGNASRSTWET